MHPKIQKTHNKIHNKKTRKIKDKAAVKYLTEKGWINLDSNDVLQDYGFQSIKLANFAETLGANGELVNYALDASAAAFLDLLGIMMDCFQNYLFFL